MRLNINLATKPYQDVRRFLLRWSGVVVLLAVCTMALVWTAASTWRKSRDVNAKISVVRSEIAVLDRQHDQAVATLGLPQNKSVVEDSKFLNGLIIRKSFSWTRVFMQLEQIMPPRLHVVSISPTLQRSTNTMEVHMQVAGSSREAAVELVKRLEKSPSFRDARITEERALHDQNNPDTVMFQVTALYVPTASAGAQTPETKVAEARGGAR